MSIKNGVFMTDQELKDLVASLAVESRETDRILTEKFAETDRMIKELGRRIGGIDDNQGYHAEQFFQNVLMEKLTFDGQKYNRMLPNLEFFGEKGVSLLELDMVLVNGKSIAIIEVKNRIHPSFIAKFVKERLPKFREYFPAFSKHKTYLGIAGFSFSKKVIEEAEKYGVGIIRQVGDSVEIKTEKLKAY